MRYRLEQQHYYQGPDSPTGVLLEPMTEVGDGTSYPWRKADGSPMAPSLSMVPIDDEAKKLYREYHHSDKPNRDPTAAIPLQGTGDKTKVPPPGPRPASPAPIKPTTPAAVPHQSSPLPTNAAFAAPEKK